MTNCLPGMLYQRPTLSAVQMSLGSVPTVLWRLSFGGGVRGYDSHLDEIPSRLSCHFQSDKGSIAWECKEWQFFLMICSLGN